MRSSSSREVAVAGKGALKATLYKGLFDGLISATANTEFLADNEACEDLGKAGVVQQINKLYEKVISVLPEVTSWKIGGGLAEMTNVLCSSVPQGCIEEDVPAAYTPWTTAEQTTVSCGLNKIREILWRLPETMKAELEESASTREYCHTMHAYLRNLISRYDMEEQMRDGGAEFNYAKWGALFTLSMVLFTVSYLYSDFFVGPDLSRKKKKENSGLPDKGVRVYGRWDGTPNEKLKKKE